MPTPSPITLNMSGLGEMFVELWVLKVNQTKQTLNKKEPETKSTSNKQWSKTKHPPYCDQVVYDLVTAVDAVWFNVTTDPNIGEKYEHL